ncbi:transposase [Cutibacterium avidum]|uniref:transposase n=1 Tax=Cutibacterium avidum TaxID=33010 RepID=UPI00192C23E5|nr:transposase [Cutibacterium avidum]QQY15482.1 transposase [Cutibacterium avidum]
MYPKEFRDGVVAAARRGDMNIMQIAKDFGIAESCLRTWIAQDDVELGNRPGVTKAENEDLKKTRRWIKELEMENGVLRRAAAYLSQANLKLGPVPQCRSPSSPT